MGEHVTKRKPGYRDPGGFELSPQAEALIAACILPTEETTNELGDNIILAMPSIWRELREAFPRELWDNACNEIGEIE